MSTDVLTTKDLILELIKQYLAINILWITIIHSEKGRDLFVLNTVVFILGTLTGNSYNFICYGSAVVLTFTSIEYSLQFPKVETGKVLRSWR